MNIVRVDLNWKQEGQAAIVVVDEAGRVEWGLWRFPNGLLALVAGTPSRLVVPDIPINGMDRLVSRGFRSVDRALQRSGGPMHPSTSAMGQGEEPARHVVAEADVPADRVWEIYPYATFKLLSSVRGRCGLASPVGRRVHTLLDRGFGTFWPLPYKRNSHRWTRQQGMAELHGFLSNPKLGMEFSRPLPPSGSGGYSTKLLSNTYNAALAGMLELHLARDDQWPVVKGDRESGDMALLADQWLSEELD